MVSGKNIVSWKSRLASGIAYANNCQLIYRYAKFKNGETGWGYVLIGRAKDVEISRYLFDLIFPQIEYLAKMALLEGQGQGKSWSNSFRMGAVETVVGKLIKSKNEVFAQSHNSAAMVLLKNQKEEVEKWVETNLALKKRSYGGRISQGDAYVQGREAGHQVRLSPGLDKGTPNKRLS